MKKVLVLMATHNGEKYIEDQLLSILNQKNVDVDILVSDDNSCDTTIEIIKKYLYTNKIKITSGVFGSPQKNFYNLINVADGINYDYYAFSDQDDVWIEDKLENAISKLSEEKNEFLFYSCNSLPVDENLNSLNSKYKTKLVDAFSKSLICSNTQGATMVINRKLLNLLKGKESQTKIMHDVWIHKTTLLIGGKVLFDSSVGLYYRIHSNNVVYKRRKLIDKIIKKVNDIFTKKDDYLISKLILEWENNFNDEITDNNKEIINKIKNTKKFSNRIKIICSKEFDSPFLFENINFKIRCLRGKL